MLKIEMRQNFSYTLNELFHFFSILTFLKIVISGKSSNSAYIFFNYSEKKGLIKITHLNFIGNSTTKVHVHEFYWEKRKITRLMNFIGGNLYYERSCT
jgi:hypothetical protein